mmetsp:Transcript_116398/g.202056  ORF Transcript_116398/g.202056 Transcript_116398/m.202056 type:complete len:91 (+) Transcript_116398:440-712(+)
MLAALCPETPKLLVAEDRPTATAGGPARLGEAQPVDEEWRSELKRSTDPRPTSKDPRLTSLAAEAFVGCVARDVPTRDGVMRLLELIPRI